MATLQWDDKLQLDLPELDSVHHEFVDLLAQAETTSDAALPALWQTIITHTEGHFGMEDRWMLATGFAPDNCHLHQHQAVLDILREGAAKAAGGDTAAIRAMIPDLANWFSYHAKTMDAALVYHLQSTGFDIHAPLPAAPTVASAAEPATTGCGCASHAQ